MKILVTGGAGFQGSHVSEYLSKKGHQVTILNHRSGNSEQNASYLSRLKNPPEIIWGSIVDQQLVKKLIKGKSLVIHMAAKVHVGESIADPNLYLRKNVSGTFTILEAIRNIEPKKRPRLIYWSTCEVYGEPVRGKLSENSEHRPKSPYAATKAAADRLCYGYHFTYNMPITIVRPFNIFGERQKAGKGGALIPVMVEQAVARKPLIISGTGRQTRDYMYISDLMSGLQIVIDHPELNGQAINFATGKNTSVLTIASYIARKFSVRVKFGPARPGEVMSFPADIRKARKLGFKPKLSIWEGIDRYINWRLKL